MTTELRKPVSRVCATSMVRYKGKFRKMVVTLLPGDVIELRPQGTQWRLPVSMQHLWSEAVALAAAKLRADRKAARAARRSK